MIVLQINAVQVQERFVFCGLAAARKQRLQRKAPDSIGKTLEEYNRMFPDAVYPEEFTTTKKDGTVVNVLETVSKVAEVIAITHAKSIEK